MTMENEQIVEPAAVEVPEAPADIGLDGITDITDTTDILDVSDAQIEVPAEPQAAPPAEPAVQQPVAAAPDPQLEAMAAQNAALQQQVNQWTQWQQQQQMERQILEEANATRQQLESQGYSDDQVEHLVTQQQAFQRREAELQSNLQRTQLHEQGRYRAAMYYGKQHGVDAEQLLPYNTPQEMESRAREIGRIAQLEAKLSKYEKAQIPPQNFDSGTSQVAAASNEETWLERYNAGDRSEQAAAAARRAAGLQ